MLTRRVLGQGVSGLILAAASNTVAAATAPGDPYAVVDPELREKVRAFKSSFPAPFTHEALMAVRKAGDASPPFLAAPKVEEIKIPGIDGAPEIPIYLINRSEGQSKPAVLHIHGGGFMAGSAKSRVRMCQQMAMTQDAVVVTVDYRLAPETPYPGPLNDCFAALQWLFQNARALGVDTRRIALKGESAGGTLATMLAFKLRDSGQFPVCAQILLYPALDDRTGSVHKVTANLPYTWKPEGNIVAWTYFLGVPAGTSQVPKGVVPARIDNLAGLPPTFIGVGSIDILVEEDVAFANRLRTAKVPTELLVLPGAVHGFDNFAPETTLAKTLTSTWNDALARAFRHAAST